MEVLQTGNELQFSCEMPPFIRKLNFATPRTRKVGSRGANGVYRPIHISLDSMEHFRNSVLYGIVALQVGRLGKTNSILNSYFTRTSSETE